MEQSQNFLLTLTAILFCACAVASLPTARSSSATAGAREEANEDFGHLIDLLGKLKNVDSHEKDSASWDLLSEDRETGKLDSTQGQAKKLVRALTHSLRGYNKRNYSYDVGTKELYGKGGDNKRNYSYDYGLGGGRFGKRYYGDYGIGGGRFGRDVDHVDIADTNDATL